MSDRTTANSFLSSQTPSGLQGDLIGQPHIPFSNSEPVTSSFSCPVVQCWGVTEGAAGTISQVRGLARAVGFPFDLYNIPLRQPWKNMWPGLIPVRPWVLTRPELLELAPPKLLITSGRQSILTSLYFKRRYGRHIFTVHIQDPKLDTRRFDLVVAPQHDGLTGPNVLQTMGAVHHINPALLEEASTTAIGSSFDELASPYVLVLIGGPTKYYKFSPADMARFEEKLARLGRTGVRLAILSSRRTPTDIVDRLRRRFGSDHFVWNPDEPNPYLTALANCSHIVLTCDSVSMITEASATGKPVFVEYLTEQRKARRFRRLFQSFENAGITRRFEGQLSEWVYEPRLDTTTVARTVLERMRETGCLDD